MRRITIQRFSTSAMAVIWPEAATVRRDVWEAVTKAALRAAVLDRVTCLTERKQTGPLLSTLLRDGSKTMSESRHLRATFLGKCSAFDIDAIVESPEFIAEWALLIATADTERALAAAHQILSKGPVGDGGQTAHEEALFSRHDGTELWWLQPPQNAEEVLAEAFAHARL